MTAALAVLFAVIGFLLTLAGMFMSENGKSENDRFAGLFCVVSGALFIVGAIFLALLAFVPNFWS